MQNTLWRLTGLIVLTAALLLTACSEDSDKPAKKKKPVHLVETASVKLESVGLTQIRTGSLTSPREVKIFNQEEGTIIEMPYFEGDTVSKGDVVVRLDDKILRANLTRAQATHRKTKLDLKRIQDLYKKKLSSDEALNRSETELAIAAAEQEMFATRVGYTVISAPISGIVSQRLSEPGNIAERYTHLLTISDHSALVTEVNVSELMVSHLNINDDVTVIIDALGNTVFDGRISRIHPNLDPLTRRGTVEVTLTPVPTGARPGQLCRVTFNTRTAERLMIPFRALRRDNKGEYVFLLDGSKVVRASILSGLRIAEQVEILQGLETGQRVVTRGFLDLVENKPVKDLSQPDGNSDKPQDKGAH
ncbi:MAG: efflux RND transporter periplasmic adaptor subunit [Arenicellales bacterium]|jgi:membrane fusion protein (multidrug efflux system)